MQKTCHCKVKDLLLPSEGAIFHFSPFTFHFPTLQISFFCGNFQKSLLLNFLLKISHFVFSISGKDTMRNRSWTPYFRNFNKNNIPPSVRDKGNKK